MSFGPLWHIIIFLLFSSFAYGQNIADSGFTNKAEAKNLLTADSVQNGKWVQYFMDTNFETETEDTGAPYYLLTSYKEGIPCGKARGYLKNGRLLFEIPYDKSGLLAGTAKKYYESGEMRETAPWVNGKKTGIEKEYYKSGKLFRETPYMQDKANGTEKIYYENGILKGEAHFINNKENGLEKSFYPNGKLHYVVTYVDDSAIEEEDYGISGYAIEIPDFIKRYDDWWIKNCKDSLRFMQTDTLKLILSDVMLDNHISFDIDSTWFTITTDNRIDSNLLDKNGNKIPTVITSILWKEGQWNFSKKDNLLTFYLSNKQRLVYRIEDLAYDKILLIKQKTEPATK